jgi:aminomethyltransferase
MLRACWRTQKRRFVIIEGSVMARTPLYEKLIASGARMGEYAGAETAVAFGPHHDTVQHSFDVLRSGCAVYDLGWRAKLALTGADRVRWLNGMVTNNIRDLAPDHGVYNFVLSPQGRIQGDCYAYNRGEYILVGTEIDQAPRLKEIFDKYIIMDDVEVTDISDKLTAIGVQGPEARSVLERAGIAGLDVGPMELRDITWNNIGLTITRMASEDFVTYELWFAPASAAVIWDALVSAGATPVGTDALELFRIAAGVPKYGQDIRERDLPQETNQSHALHFAKGCYVGQEIVERIRSRGILHREFSGFAIEGTPPQPGTKIQAGDRNVAEITSVATIPGSGTVALGYRRSDAAPQGAVLEVNGTSARVTELPFKQEQHG